MQDIYIICRYNEDGTEAVMNTAYSTQEYAMEALQVFRAEAAKRNERSIYYHSVLTLVK